ncbi:hypothetical protein AURDEDRAFT_124014 [Auricularia subglabra TFB-10046 SS5]|nr:hypothetical protein AURDEDRAFT_124014 [Auricularia subglabra TFB-10046 SS5]
MLKLIGIILLGALNAYIVLKAPAVRKSGTGTYCHDFPNQLPLDRELEMVYMLPEESAYYPLGEAGNQAWSSFIPDGGVYCRLGPRHRLFIAAMFHELHCLQILNYGFGSGMALSHVMHCLTYLRHGALCSADLTLEPGDFTLRNFTRDRVGPAHLCRDWSQIYNAYEESRNTWEAASQRLVSRDDP